MQVRKGRTLEIDESGAGRDVDHQIVSNLGLWASEDVQCSPDVSEQQLVVCVLSKTHFTTVKLSKSEPATCRC